MKGKTRGREKNKTSKKGKKGEIKLKTNKKAKSKERKEPAIRKQSEIQRVWKKYMLKQEHLINVTP